MAIKTIQRPEIWNMTLYSGDTWPWDNFNVIVDGIAASGFSVLMQVRSGVGGTIVKEINNGNGFYVVANNVEFDTTVDIPAGEYVFDIQITLADGEIYTQYAGVIKVVGDVTA